MTTQAPTNEQQTSVTEAKDPGELTFPEYEAMRRGEKLEADKPEPAAEKASEQSKRAESDPAESKAKDESEDDPESDADEADDKGDDSEKDKPKRKSGTQRLKEKLAQEQTRREALEERLARLEGAGDKKADKAEPKPDTTGKPNPDSFETHAEYVEALTDWKLEQKEKASKEQEARSKLEAEIKSQEAAYQKRVETFKESVKDYDDTLAELDDIIFPAAVLDAIQSSDLGPQIAYDLAQDRKEAERIAALSPGAAYKAIGKLEAKLEAKAAEAKKPEPKKTTSAPAPIDPVGSGKSTVKKSPEEMSYSEYERYRRDQLKRKNA